MRTDTTTPVDDAGSRKDTSPSEITPEFAYSEFVRAWRAFEAGQGTYEAADAAQKLLRATLTPDAWRKLWWTAKAKGEAGEASHITNPLYLFGEERDARWDKGPQRKAYEKKRATNPGRKAQVKAAHARYRAKKRLEKALAAASKQEVGDGR